MTAPETHAPRARVPHALDALVAGFPVVAVRGSTTVVVDHFGHDSREVEAGGLFIATRGTAWDGHRFIAGALERGARAVIAEEAPPADLAADVTWLTVREGDGMAALAHVSAAWYGHPGRDVRVLATTGTNGKTTTTYLLRTILEAVGEKVGLVSTVEIAIGGRHLPTIFTTPPSPQFQELLATMRDERCGFAVVEASSHGLHQRRIAGFRVAVGGFSNLTRDHLDYHGTMEAYAEAKAILFRELADAAAFNVDDATGVRFAAEFPGRKLTVSATGREADLSVMSAEYGLDGTHAIISTSPAARGTVIRLDTRLIGPHNLQNALLALAMARLAGVDLVAAAEALRTTTGAPGRLEPVHTASSAAEPAVFVDYAHSPDALENVLRALRPLVPGRLVCVFGAGGDRDKGKRPQMAEIAARLADEVVATSDNPRTEDPDAILDDIVAGFAPGVAFVREVDRRAAIHRAIAAAGPGDAVLIAGKGHENYQILGTTKHPFDDVAVAREALAARAAPTEGGR